LRPTTQLTPLCVIVSVCPAIVAVSTRDTGSGFGGTSTVTVLLPAPPDGSMSRPSAFAALHEHTDDEAATVTGPLPPVAVAENSTGLITKPQVEPNWLMTSSCPLTVIVPVRSAGFVFAAMR